MAEKTLDFNQFRKPTLLVTLCDDQKTVVRVTVPSLDLVEEMQARLPGLQAMLDGSSRESEEELYDIAARLISCNRDLLRITADELKTKYDMAKEDLIIFFGAYVDFITGIKNEKN